MMTEKRIDLTKATAAENYWYFFQLAAASNDIFSSVQATEAVEEADNLNPVIKPLVGRHLVRILQAFLITALTKFIYLIEPDKSNAIFPVREWIKQHSDLDKLFGNLRVAIDDPAYRSFKKIRNALTFHYSENDQNMHSKEALIAMAKKWEELGREDGLNLNLVLIDDNDSLMSRFVTADWMLHFAWAPMMGFDPTVSDIESPTFHLSQSLLKDFVTFADAAFERWCDDNDIWIQPETV